MSGKRQKKRQYERQRRRERQAAAHKRKWKRYVIRVALVGIVVGFIIWKPGRHTPSPAEVVKATIDGYFAEVTTSSEWWLTEVPPSGTAAYFALAEVIERRKDRISKLVARVAEEALKGGRAHQIAASFPELFVSLYQNGHALIVRKGAAPTTTGQEICFIAARQFAHEGIRKVPSIVYWNDAWNAAMIAAIEWPEPVLGGLLIHELGHGWKRTVRQVPKSEVGTIAYAAEEIEMHRAQFEAISVLSDSAYTDAVHAIVDRSEHASVKRFLSSITIADMHRLDRAIGAEDAGKEIARILLGQHYIMCAIEYARKHNVTDRRLAELYWWCRDIAFGGR